MKRLAVCVAWLSCVVAAPFARAAGEPADLPANFRTIPTSYYIMRTDGSDDLAREAYIRMDRMFEEYASRTSAFSKPPRDKFPFFLFTKREDYYKAGGTSGSAGVFQWNSVTGGRLMGIADPNGKGHTWHVVQHEGFHQFAFTSIARNLPTWVNEGLAEYFGEAKFTGDAFVSGLVPDGRRKKIVRMIEENAYKAFPEFVTITPRDWSAKLSINNYDQAWAMVHFLAEGDGGKYQKAFVGYMSALSRGGDPQQAWAAQFGTGAGNTAFETAWKKYWSGMAANPSKMLLHKARNMTLASFVARANLSGQRFDTFEKFFAAAKAKEVKLANDAAKWLPPSLLEDALADRSLDAGDITLEWRGSVPTLTEKLEDGSLLVVSFANSRTTATTRPAPATAASKPAK